MLAVAALEFAEREMPATPFDIVHAHDWQAGLAPAWLRDRSRRFPRSAGAGIVFTIHNLAYQGLFPEDVVPALGLPWDGVHTRTRRVLGEVQLPQGRHHLQRLS